MEITSTLHMEEYLTSRSIPFTDIQILTGGGSNYSWRVWAADSAHARSIVKHATPYLKILRRVSLPVERLDIEAHAISVLSHCSIFDVNDHVEVPKLLHYDQKSRFIQISDAGSRNLVEAFMSAELDLPTVGSRLGKWLAQLHSASKDLKIGDNKLVELASQHCTQHLPAALRERGYDETVGQRILAFLFDSKEDDACQCHGDFLPCNIVLSDDQIPTPRLTVIDWEWTRRGNGAFDVALFAGEVWLMEYFQDRRGLFDAFLESYVKNRPMNLEDSLIVAARLAVHITYWATREKWGPGGRCVDIGYVLLQKVLEPDLMYLRQSIVRGLFQRPLFSAKA